MNSLRMLALVLVIASVAACRPPVAEEVGVPVEVVDEQITDAVTEEIQLLDEVETEEAVPVLAKK